MSQRVYDRGPPTAADDIARMENRIQHQLGKRIRDLRLEIRHSGIVLKGRARTYHARQLAQHAVCAATDVPIVENEIDVM